MATAQEKTTYKYIAQTPNGTIEENKIKANNPQAVTEYLLGQGYAPISVTEETLLSKDISIGKKGVNLKTLTQTFRQFATLNKAGMPLLKTLDLMAKQTQNPTLQNNLETVKQDITNGDKLGEALAKHPQTFPPVVIAMVTAGEKGGFLTETLEGVADNLEADLKLKQKIKSAMTYPVAILGLAGILVTIMLIFIVPIFDDMFTSLGGNLPLPTQMLVTLSKFVQTAGIPLLIVIIGFVIWWNKNKNKQNIREFIDPIKNKLPIFGPLIQKIAIARFTRNFSALLTAGLPIMQVLDIVGETSGSTVLEQALEDVKQITANGDKLSQAFTTHPIFPDMLIEMTAVGEDSGDIPGMMSNVAYAYDQEVNTTTEQLSSLMEPLMLVVLGTIVGGIVIALYLPIFSIFDLIN